MKPSSTRPIVSSTVPMGWRMNQSARGGRSRLADDSGVADGDVAVVKGGAPGVASGSGDIFAPGWRGDAHLRAGLEARLPVHDYGVAGLHAARDHRVVIIPIGSDHWHDFRLGVMHSVDVC